MDQSKLSGWVDSNPTTPRENGHKVCCTTAGPPPEGKRRKTNRIVPSLLFPVGWTSSLILEALPESLICLSSGRREREWRCHLLPFLSAHDSASSRECPPLFILALLIALFCSRGDESRRAPNPVPSALRCVTRRTRHHHLPISSIDPSARPLGLGSSQVMSVLLP